MNATFGGGKDSQVRDIARALAIAQIFKMAKIETWAWNIAEHLDSDEAIAA